VLILEILTKELVVFPMEASTKEEVLSRLSDALLKEKRISSKEIFLEDVLKREQDFSTGFGDGFAIPHGKSESVLSPSIAVGKCSEAVEWEALDGKPVSLVFLLAIPESQAGTTHLKILAKLAENLMDDEIKDHLMNLNTSEELYHYISKMLGGL